nr:radical SAM family heme chaperone HemW [uncultured Acetatifactor sp.]
MTENRELQLYFHIPFCERKCLYCDFLSAPGSEKEKEAYMDALLEELEGRAEDFSDRTVSGIFFGGGTPSLVSGERIKELMEAVRRCYRLSGSAEVTMEVNPGTADGDKLLCYRSAGVNRLSIGLQSAKDEELALLGRIHDFDQFLDVWEAGREAGFQNMSVDIMSALPGQTLDSFTETLYKVLTLEKPPEHISVYSLIVEEGTVFAQLFKEGKLILPDEDSERFMYGETKRILEEHGYQRYEISNYAKPGFACRHNCGYWMRKDYLGFGIGSASLIDNVRFQNSRDLRKFLEDPLSCREELQRLSREERMEEFVFLGLRMTRGISPLLFRREFGVSLEEIYGGIIEKNQKDGLLFYRIDPDTEEKMLALTDRGLDLSNYCMAQFLLS